MKEGSSSVCAMEHHSTANTIHGGAESDFREKKLTTWEGREEEQFRAQSQGGPPEPDIHPQCSSWSARDQEEGLVAWLKW